MENRELDALVAEKIFGASHSSVGDASWMHFPTTGPYEDCDCAGHMEAMAVPAYSSDMAAAWEVAEKFEAMQLFRYTTRQYIVCMADGNSLHEGQASTAPLAICLAALKAVGVEVPA